LIHFLWQAIEGVLQQQAAAQQQVAARQNAGVRLLPTPVPPGTVVGAAPIATSPGTTGNFVSVSVAPVLPTNVAPLVQPTQEVGTVNTPQGAAKGTKRPAVAAAIPAGAQKVPKTVA